MVNERLLENSLNKRLNAPESKLLPQWPSMESLNPNQQPFPSSTTTSRSQTGPLEHSPTRPRLSLKFVGIIYGRGHGLGLNSITTDPTLSLMHLMHPQKFWPPRRVDTYLKARRVSTGCELPHYPRPHREVYLPSPCSVLHHWNGAFGLHRTTQLDLLALVCDLCLTLRSRRNIPAMG